MPLSEQDRKICETIVEAFMEKCDMVNPDGSTHEDYERDLIEPFATALRLAREEGAKEISKKMRKYLVVRDGHNLGFKWIRTQDYEALKDTIRSLLSSPAAEEYDPPELESWAVKEGKP